MMRTIKKNFKERHNQGIANLVIFFSMIIILISVTGALTKEDPYKDVQIFKSNSSYVAVR